VKIRTLLNLGIVGAGILLFSTDLLAASITLQWTPNYTRADGSPLAPNEICGFKISYGSSSGNYGPVPIDIPISDATSTVLDNLEIGTTYFLAIKEYDCQGNISDFSNEIQRTLTAANPDLEITIVGTLPKKKRAGTVLKGFVDIKNIGNSDTFPTNFRIFLLQDPNLGGGSYEIKNKTAGIPAIKPYDSIRMQWQGKIQKPAPKGVYTDVQVCVDAYSEVNAANNCANYGQSLKVIKALQ
jgi:hypothetical protein